MSKENSGLYGHRHNFNHDTFSEERKTWTVIILTFLTMVVEIIAGYAFGSMALLADGWHMSTHTAALSITVFAYRYARRHIDDPKFTFGTGKVGVLGGFASAIGLAVVAFMMAIESIERIISPVQIQFDQAILVAVIGLLVNVVSAFILSFGTHHHHSHGTGDDHHTDYNLKAAYFHVIADAMTSLLAIAALLTGKFMGWIWLDPIMGIVGAGLITRWSYLLIRDTSKVLLDCSADSKTIESIRRTIESEPETKVWDLHLWQLSEGHFGVIVSILTSRSKPPEYYKKLLENNKYLSHVTIEVNQGETQSPLY